MFVFEEEKIDFVQRLRDGGLYIMRNDFLYLAMNKFLDFIILLIYQQALVMDKKIYKK